MTKKKKKIQQKKPGYYLDNVTKKANTYPTLQKKTLDASNQQN